MNKFNPTGNKRISKSELKKAMKLFCGKVPSKEELSDIMKKVGGAVGHGEGQGAGDLKDQNPSLKFCSSMADCQVKGELAILCKTKFTKHRGI